MPSKNNDQSLVHVKVSRNKVSIQLFNSDTIKDHVSTNHKDISIPKKKDIDIPKKKMSPQNKDMDIPSKSNNQSSVHVEVPRNKASNLLFNSVRYRYAISTYHDGCQHTMCLYDVSIPYIHVIFRCQQTTYFTNIYSIH